MILMKMELLKIIKNESVKKLADIVSTTKGDLFRNKDSNNYLEIKDGGNGYKFVDDELNPIAEYVYGDFLFDGTYSKDFIADVNKGYILEGQDGDYIVYMI